MQSPCDRLIVTLDKAFEDELVFKSGVKLFKPTHLNPEWHTTCTGTVVAVPKRLSGRDDLKGLSIQAEVGDTVIFSYMVVFDMDIRDRDTPLHRNLFFFEGNYYWKVDYFHVLGFIRNGKIQASQGFVFAEEIEHEPTPEKIGLLYMPESKVKEKKKGIAKVLSVGAARSDEPTLSLSEGDTIHFDPIYCMKYEVRMEETKQYFVLHQRNITCKQII